jgi:ATP-dependent DNA ligase
MNDVFLLTPSEIVSKYRVSMEEVATIEKAPAKYDLFQLKFDGWWVAVRILKDQMQIITSGADIRKTYKIENPLEVEALFIGEWMYGTNWAGKNDPGQIFIHDVVHWEFNDMLYDHQVPSGSLSYFDGTNQPYNIRLPALKRMLEFLPTISPLLKVLNTYSIQTLESVWNDSPDYEGVVLKQSASGLGSEMIACKIKREFKADFVIMAVNEGGGRLKGKMGSLDGGQYENGKLVSVCSIGGGFSDLRRKRIWLLRERMIERVLEAKGKGLFKGGALRHPNFSRWRPDKLPTQCIRR